MSEPSHIVLCMMSPSQLRHPELSHMKVMQPVIPNGSCLIQLCKSQSYLDISLSLYSRVSGQSSGADVMQSSGAEAMQRVSLLSLSLFS